MKIFEAGTSNWTEREGYQEVELSATTGQACRVWVLRVPSGSSYGPFKGTGSRHFFVCLHTAGARLHLGARIFRPMPGQTFECEPGEVFGVVNDTRDEVRLLVTRLGSEQDVQPLGKTWEAYLAEVRPGEAQLISTTSNPEAR